MSGGTAGKTAQEGKKPNKVVDAIIVVVLLVLGVGGIAAFGFYRDEVSAYMRLQAWDLEPTAKGTREFLAAMSAKDANRVEGLFTGRPDDVRVVREDGRVALTVSRFGSSRNLSLDEIVPSADGQVGRPQLVTLEGGAVVVPISFPGTDLSLDVRWDRVNGQWKIIKVTRIRPGE